MPSAVELLFQPPMHLREGEFLLARGNEGGNAPLQLCVLIHRQCAVANEGAAGKDLLSHPQQHFPCIFFADPRGIPHEEERLAIGLMGPFGRSALDRRRAVSNEESMLWLKGAVEELAAALHTDQLSFTPVEHPAFEPGWSAEVKIGKQKAGVIGLAKKALRHPWRMTQPMALCELRLSVLLKKADEIKIELRDFKAIPEYIEKYGIPYAHKEINKGNTNNAIKNINNHNIHFFCQCCRWGCVNLSHSERWHIVCY